VNRIKLGIPLVTFGGMLRTHLNYFLAVLYCRGRFGRQGSSGDSTLVQIVKLQLGGLLFLYVMPLMLVLGRLWTHRQTDLNITSALLLLAVLFVLVHLLAWPTERVIAWALDEANQGLRQQAQRKLLVLLVVGFGWMVVAATYNAGTL